MSVEQVATEMTPAAGKDGGCGCGCGGAKPPASPSTERPSFVYALGRVAPRFSTESVEKEFAHAAARIDAKGMTDQQTMHAVLSDPANRYLVRSMCWVFSVEGMPTYILAPRDPGDVPQLLATLRQTPAPSDMDVVIGVRGPVAPPNACRGLSLPIVIFEQLYSFDRDSLLKQLPKPSDADANEFGAAASEVVDRVLQLADNAGGTDEHRAVNYLAMRYAAIYNLIADAYRRNRSLAAVDVRPSPLSGVRTLVDVVFSLRDRTTDVVEKHAVRVDVTEQFPFLAAKLAPYFDR